jgi:hypothetical protein
VTDPRAEKLREELMREIAVRLKPGYVPTPGESRGRVFPAVVAAVFFAVGLGVLAVAPILRWECERDATGAVNCVVKKRLAGVIPIGDVTLSNILAADVRTEESPALSRSGQPYSAAFLVVACADGTRFRPFDSSEPLGRSHVDVAQGIRDLLDADSPSTFRAWQGETVPLLVGAVFVVPMAILVALVLLRVALFAFWS